VEKVMSKNNDISQVRELRDDELEKVSGGYDASKNEVAIETVEGFVAYQKVVNQIITDNKDPGGKY
jgi:hypothetical protein